MGYNLFERARNIRLHGENWQNAIQRAKAQITYEIQIGGNKPRKNHNKTLGEVIPCTVSRTTGRCGKNSDGVHPELCGQRRKSKTGRITCYRTDKPRDPRFPMNYNKNPKISLYKPGHVPDNKFRETGPRPTGPHQAKPKTYADQRQRDKKSQPQIPQEGGYFSSTSSDECMIDPTTGRCGKSSTHTEAPELCRERRKNFTGHRTCHRIDEPSRSKYPIHMSEAQQEWQTAVWQGRGESHGKGMRFFEKGHIPDNKGKKTGHHKGHEVHRGYEGHEDHRGYEGHVGNTATAAGGGYLDNLTDTSATRTSDFTSVSDTTSYTMKGGDSFTSNDDTSIW